MGLVTAELCRACRFVSDFALGVGQYEKALSYAFHELDIERNIFGKEVDDIKELGVAAEQWIAAVQDRMDVDKVKMPGNKFWSEWPAKKTMWYELRKEQKKRAEVEKEMVAEEEAREVAAEKERELAIQKKKVKYERKKAKWAEKKAVKEEERKKAAVEMKNKTADDQNEETANEEKKEAANEEKEEAQNEDKKNVIEAEKLQQSDDNKENVEEVVVVEKGISSEASG